MACPQRRRLLDAYYEFAPEVVRVFPLDHPIWSWTASRVSLCCSAIRGHHPDVALALYADMSLRLAHLASPTLGARWSRVAGVALGR